jgi:hypothetical protein
MDSVRYVGLDVHQETTSAAVLDSEGRLVMQITLATLPARFWILSEHCAQRCILRLKKELTRHGCMVC